MPHRVSLVVPTTTRKYCANKDDGITINILRLFECAYAQMEHCTGSLEDGGGEEIGGSRGRESQIRMQ